MNIENMKKLQKALFETPEVEFDQDHIGVKKNLKNQAVTILNCGCVIRQAYQHFSSELESLDLPHDDETDQSYLFRCVARWLDLDEIGYDAHYILGKIPTIKSAARHQKYPFRDSFGPKDAAIRIQQVLDNE